MWLNFRWKFTEQCNTSIYTITRFVQCTVRLFRKHLQSLRFWKLDYYKGNSTKFIIINLVSYVVSSATVPSLNIWRLLATKKRRRLNISPATLRPFCISFSLFCSRNVYSSCIDRSCMTYSDTFPFSQTGQRRLFLLRTKCLFTADASVTFLRGQSAAVSMFFFFPPPTTIVQ